MSVLTNLLHCLAGTGSRRAVDRIPELTAQVEYWRALTFAAQAKQVHADAMIVRLVAQRDAAQFEARELRELADLLPALRSEIANLRAVSISAPADNGPAIRLPKFDPEATEDLRVTTLWNAHGLRVA